MTNPTTPEILNHINEVLQKAGSGVSGLREDFMQNASGQIFSKPQYRAVLRAASLTGVGSINNNVSSLWHLFKDGLGKKSIFFDGGTDLTQSALDIIVFTRWNSQNFQTIMGIKPNENPPPLMTNPKDINRFSTALGYFEYRVALALEASLRQEYGWSAESLHDKIAEREARLIAENVIGTEILKPIGKWPHPQAMI